MWNKKGHWPVGNLEVVSTLSSGRPSEETMDYALVEIDRHVDCLLTAKVVGNCLIVKVLLENLVGVDLTQELYYA